MAELSEAADKAGAATRLAEAAASDVVEVARNHMAWMWGGFGAGVTVGALGGFFGAKLRLEKKYEKLAEEEIAEMRRHYRRRATAREKPDLADLNKLVKDQQYKEPGAPVSPTPDGPSVVPG